MQANIGNNSIWKYPRRNYSLLVFLCKPFLATDSSNGNLSNVNKPNLTIAITSMFHSIDKPFAINVYRY